MTRLLKFCGCEVLDESGKCARRRVGIHNAWDTVTHLVFVERRRQH